MNDLTGELSSPAMPKYVDGDFWFPVSASTVAPEIDALYYFIYWVSVFFMVLIVAIMAYFVVKYRRRPGVAPQPSPHHNQTLEITWSVIPGILVVFMFYRGMLGYMDLRTPPAETYDLRAFAKKWSWAFQYPVLGHIDSELHVAKDRPVKIIMSSADVIHSMFIPAFRVKMDVVPGRYSEIWFNANLPGDYTLFCTEYCGKSHSDMLAKVVVHSSVGEYDAWLAKAADPFTDPVTGQPRDPALVGQILYEKRGCYQCHSIDGTAKTGPSFKGTYGTEQLLADGSKVTIDDNYIRKSILEPMAQIRGGYKPAMPSFAGQLDDRQIDAIAQYIRSLK